MRTCMHTLELKNSCGILCVNKEHKFHTQDDVKEVGWTVLSHNAP